MLALAACEAEGGALDAAMPAAMAVELFHNFTLMHDDIMDEAPLRRGRPTVHIKWSENAAILSGDVMYTLALTALGRHALRRLGGRPSHVQRHVQRSLRRPTERHGV